MVNNMEDKKIYIPAPMDTSDVQLPEDLMDLVEQMAKNVHEEWAKNRMEQGWTWGAERDDANKHHPCLVEYEELPDSEKEYDRKTAVSTLKFIHKLGFIIRKDR